MAILNRREFIGGAVAATGFMSVASAADDRPLRLGLIGCGNYGMVNVNAAFKAGGVQVVAVCDVDSAHMNDSADKIEAKQGSRPKLSADYRTLLEQGGAEAVIIATPPQWHALMFIDALAKGLDIYCEKPLSYDVREGQAMAAAAEKAGRIVQIGFQRRKSKAIQQAREFVREGGIGKIVQADVQIHYTAGLRDTTVKSPPATLDWNAWCGPAPKLPYCEQIGHFAWRLEKEYGHGHLVDWGIHLIDATRWILDEGMPQSVQAAGGIYYFKDKITTPDVLTAQFDFATCPVVWRHRLWGAEEYTPEVSNGIFVYGDKGTVFVTDNKWVVIGKGRNAERKVTEIRSDMGGEHMQEFLEAVRTRKQPICTTADGHKSTATVKLAMIALETGRKIAWDADRQDIVGDAAAAKMLKRPYRAPYKHPFRS
ncbi:MAG: Gfo/Idh/MocA family oxidoreductase [Phycisphaerae bacterium]|nr:Gfo/Idh/MocA family oxidoreductase [Phycisphaerae bacterium]